MQQWHGERCATTRDAETAAKSLADQVKVSRQQLKEKVSQLRDLCMQLGVPELECPHIEAGELKSQQSLQKLALWGVYMLLQRKNEMDDVKKGKKM